MDVKGYYMDTGGTLQASDVFVYIVDNDRGGRCQVYCPIGQHSEADIPYISECKRITKKEYMEASKLFYTPEDYL